MSLDTSGTPSAHEDATDSATNNATDDVSNANAGDTMDASAARTPDSPADSDTEYLDDPSDAPTAPYAVQGQATQQYTAAGAQAYAGAPAGAPVTAPQYPAAPYPAAPYVQSYPQNPNAPKPQACGAPDPKREKRKFIGLVVVVSLLCGLAGGIGGAAIMKAVSGSDSTQQTTTQMGPGGSGSMQMPGGSNGDGMPGGSNGTGLGGQMQGGQSGNGQSGSGSGSGSDSSTSNSTDSGSAYEDGYSDTITA